jgi:hypothetical protein
MIHESFSPKKYSQPTRIIVEKECPAGELYAVSGCSRGYAALLVSFGLDPDGAF